MNTLKWMAVLGVAAAGGVAWAARASKADTEFKKMDRDHDRKTSPDEDGAGSMPMFEAMDTGEDGFVTSGELAAGHARLMPKTPAH